MELILGIIDRIESDKLVIRANGTGEIILPAQNKKWKEGDAIKIIVLKNDKTDEGNNALAKQILNEIIDGAE